MTCERHGGNAGSIMCRECDLETIERHSMTTPTPDEPLELGEPDSLAGTFIDQINTLKRELDAAQEARQRDNEGWQRTYDHDCAKLIERAQAAEARAEQNARLLREIVDAWDNGKEDDSIIASRRVTDAFIKARAAIAGEKK